MKRAIKETIEKLGGLDIIVNRREPLLPTNMASPVQFFSAGALKPP